MLIGTMISSLGMIGSTWHFLQVPRGYKKIFKFVPAVLIYAMLLLREDIHPLNYVIFKCPRFEGKDVRIEGMEGEKVNG